MSETLTIDQRIDAAERRQAELEGMVARLAAGEVRLQQLTERLTAAVEAREASA